MLCSSPESWNCLWLSTAHCGCLPVCPSCTVQKALGLLWKGGFEIAWNCCMWHNFCLLHKHQKILGWMGNMAASCFLELVLPRVLLWESTDELASSSRSLKLYGQFGANCGWYRCWFCMFNIVWYLHQKIRLWNLLFGNNTLKTQSLEVQISTSDVQWTWTS